ncbi:MAG TPA: peptide chain release factor N(5)-glutamine methyltransferase [Clostridiaceae bacterium]|nr:peptide chain release factor N(5)-glutamine methyltransferase [Clostridiaceae bacterium]
MTIKELLRKGSQILKDARIESPVRDAGVILCHVLNCGRLYLYTHEDNVPDETYIKTYINLIQERASGKPLQYITGVNEFMSLPILVTPDVLIPRPETEILVEKVIAYLKKINEPKTNILDMGTGSGCIAVSIARYVENCFVTAVDISSDALSIAYFNAMDLGFTDRISFIKSNLFEKVEKTQYFDVIVSNPPYIPSCEIESLQREVRDYEPEIALDGGADGLFYYKRIIDESPKFLKPGGMLAFEVGINEALAVVDFMKKMFCNIEIEKDLAGIDRVVSGFLR